MKTSHVRQVVSREEIHALTRRSNLAGAWAIASTWAVIAGAFAVLARWPHPLTFLGAVIVLGGRQLALGILMHEGAHRTLFRSRFANDTITDWLCARAIHGNLTRYRTHHLQHHARTARDDDPDRSLISGFPTTRSSMRRKLSRDVLGVTGLKRWLGQALMDFEVIGYSVNAEVQRLPRNGRKLGDYLRAGAKNSAGFVLVNALMLGVLAASGHAWVYTAWIVADLTAFSVFMRIRSLAEHACRERNDDPYQNTRTTHAGWLARLTVAPIRVNYHIEHHLLVAVPYYRLPRLHALLRERGVVPAPPTYLEVLGLVSSAS